LKYLMKYGEYRTKIQFDTSAVQNITSEKRKERNLRKCPRDFCNSCTYVPYQ